MPPGDALSLWCHCIAIGARLQVECRAAYLARCANCCDRPHCNATAFTPRRAPPIGSNPEVERCRVNPWANRGDCVSRLAKRLVRQLRDRARRLPDRHAVATVAADFEALEASCGDAPEGRASIFCFSTQARICTTVQADAAPLRLHGHSENPLFLCRKVARTGCAGSRELIVVLGIVGSAVSAPSIIVTAEVTPLAGSARAPLQPCRRGDGRGPHHLDHGRAGRRGHDPGECQPRRGEHPPVPIGGALSTPPVMTSIPRSIA